MTYAEFITDVQGKQTAYIAEERTRYSALLNHRTALVGDARAYKTVAYKMGLHPLSDIEILDRLAQLDQMERDIPQTHGDTVVMRWAYEAAPQAHDAP